MSYKDLPLDERLKLASQYALLLVADNKPTDEIIGILKQDYALTQEQAAQAFAAMRSNYKTDYNASVLNNLLQALGIIAFCVAAFLFYYFTAKEMAGLRTFFIIIAMLFGIMALLALIQTGRIILEKFSAPATPVSNSATLKEQSPFIRKIDDVDKTLFYFCFISLLIFAFEAYQYFFDIGTVDVKKITTIDNCIVTERVRHESTSGKNRRYYYILKLRGHNLEFRFFETYYSHSREPYLIKTIKTWDTVSVQLRNEDLDLFEDQYSEEEIEIVNLKFQGRFLVDHDYRNARVRKDNKTTFYALLAVSGSLIILIILKNLYHYLQFKRRHLAGLPRRYLR